MKKLIWLSTGHLLPILLCAYLFSSNCLSKEYIEISTGEYPPGYSKDSVKNGYVLHIIDEAFAINGIKVKFVFEPWKRAYESARKGIYDATCCWFLKEGREAFFHTSDPVAIESFYFFHLKDSTFDWSSIADLSKYRIGATIGYTLGKDFYAAEEAGQLDIKWVKGDVQNFKKLVAGRIDITPIDLLVGHELMRSYLSPGQSKMVTYHPKPLTKSSTHILFPKKLGKQSKQLYDMLNKGLEAIRKNGLHDKIMSDAIAGKYKGQL